MCSTGTGLVLSEASNGAGVTKQWPMSPQPGTKLTRTAQAPVRHSLLTCSFRMQRRTAWTGAHDGLLDIRHKCYITL
jgi:hypothetical protein